MPPMETHLIRAMSVCGGLWGGGGGREGCPCEGKRSLIMRALRNYGRG